LVISFHVRAAIFCQQRTPGKGRSTRWHADVVRLSDAMVGCNAGCGSVIAVCFCRNDQMLSFAP
jgi:hypothetical protein